MLDLRKVQGRIVFDTKVTIRPLEKTSGSGPGGDEEERGGIRIRSMIEEEGRNAIDHGKNW